MGEDRGDGQTAEGVAAAARLEALAGPARETKGVI
jgi:hypothetical protein